MTLTRKALIITLPRQIICPLCHKIVKSRRNDYKYGIRGKRVWRGKTYKCECGITIYLKEWIDRPTEKEGC